jgi:hypothetical protein
MLSRYQIERGKAASAMPPELRDAIRQDTRKHTRHVLRPTVEIVAAYLDNPTGTNWNTFKVEYQRILQRRFSDDRVPIDELARLAQNADVILGCSCPTAKNPNVKHCHTWLALEFMRAKYGKLEIRFPER